MQSQLLKSQDAEALGTWAIASPLLWKEDGVGPISKDPTGGLKVEGCNIGVICCKYKCSKVSFCSLILVVLRTYLRSRGEVNQRVKVVGGIHVRYVSHVRLCSVPTYSYLLP